MFKNQPKGLYILALANTGERFGYYTMIAILLLYLQAKFGFSTSVAGQVYSVFLAVVYFLPVIGGWIADRWSFRKTVTLGLFVMLAGYAVMSVPTERGTAAAVAVLISGLLLICIGTGLFKGNLQVMIGDLYDDPRYSDRRDMGFSIFYMAINIGAMFAPAASEWLCNIALRAEGLTYNSAIPSICNALLNDGTLPAADMAVLRDFAGAGTDVTAFAARYMDTICTGYGYAFALAVVSLVISYIIYFLGRRTYAHVGNAAERAAADSAGQSAAHTAELTPAQTRSRIRALMLVFAVVIFFWMVFHQSGATLTKFAEVFTENQSSGWTRIGFNVWALAVIAAAVYALFGIFQNRTLLSRLLSGASFLLCGGLIAHFYMTTPDPVAYGQPQIFQQFDPFYVVALTPFSIAFFEWLHRRGKEPSAPRKIGLGMIVAALAFIIMSTGSIGLGVAPVAGQGQHLVSPDLLISSYLVLTLAELFLSPMGISFVSKVAPPKYKGAMMGCWFGATAIGNYLVVIPTILWNRIDVSLLWAILAALCLLSAAFIFSQMKKLDAATAD